MTNHDPLVLVLATSPLPGTPRTLGQGLTTEQLLALAVAVRRAVSLPVLELHRPCHVGYGPCELIPANERGRAHYGPEGCVCCRERWPCATVEALGPRATS